MQNVNLEQGYVVFQKVKGLQIRSRRKKRLREKVKKPFTPAPVRIPKARKPSKTKISKRYTLVKNLERKKASMVKQPGGFKPKPAHEKRLFKSDEKPRE